MAITATTPTAHNLLSDYRDPFQARYDIDTRLPKELREQARGMDWGLFMATYAPAPTMQVVVTGVDKLNWCDSLYTAELTRTSKTRAPETTHCEVTASGPLAAISAILAEHGRYVEVLAFHQIALHEATVTCVKVAHQVNHTRSAWAVGFGPNPAHSVASALSAGAQRIYGNL
ncbi:acetyl-CoA acetyltransferase [Corynebacterium liangguodongii]|uniref:Acetyl-CoA acetyltransferase n=1 Tax=Corynebacterium liangguodongii TaxID=2079535 RepID=A0A2S0WG66_9CORY|nr:acetyl-CoA acetyltransferase [Corynebacterium liangguodongii]AWB84682.1 acetyl-CoA acetyltransferase [Corynebacterium liangguodongii]PWB99690.1 acetyl-CoA acetyltransferase [Corynebacterium liangguodongii]